jgi:hypothetical protein
MYAEMANLGKIFRKCYQGNNLHLSKDRRAKEKVRKYVYKGVLSLERHTSVV